MADQNLTEKTAASSVSGTDIIYVLVDPTGTPADRKFTIANLSGHVRNNIVEGDIPTGMSTDKIAGLSGSNTGDQAFDTLTNVTVDVLSNRPAASTADDLFYATDEEKMYRDDGASWNVINAGTADSADGLSAGALDAIGEIASSLRSGSDTTIITGTAGTSGNFIQWNVDGDAVDSGNSASDFANSSHNHAAGDINSGTFADARISESSVTQHEGAIDHEQLTNKVEHLMVSASDETTDLTTGTGKVTFRMPYALTITEVRANVNTAPAGSDIIVDINDGGTTIFGTNNLHIDAGEKTSETSATAPDISDTALADDAEITIDIDQIGSSTAGKGLKVTIIGTR